MSEEFQSLDPNLDHPRGYSNILLHKNLQPEKLEPHKNEYAEESSSISSKDAKSFNILTDGQKPINQVFVLTPKKGQIISEDEKKNCKVLKFTSAWKYEESLIKIARLDPKIYQNLFILVIESEEIQFFGQNKTEETENIKCETLMKILLNFCTNRPMLLQLASKTENMTKFYFKQEISKRFQRIDNCHKEVEEIIDFPSFFRSFLTSKVEDFENLMDEKLLNVQNSSLIVRFLRTLELSDGFFFKIIKKFAAKGSKDDLMAALDASFDNILNAKSQNLLGEELKFENWICDFNEVEIVPEDQKEEINGLRNENSGTDKSQKINTKHSILSIAVINKNKQIVDILVKNFRHLIEELSIYHKFLVSTAAYILKQFDILCDLLEIGDFPFPMDFNSNAIANERLEDIIRKRIKFHENIANGNSKEIQELVDQNSSIKYAFGTNNCTALAYALSSKQLKVFHELKSHGFKAIEFLDYMEEIEDKKYKKLAKSCAKQQRMENIRNAHSDEERTIKLFLMRSLIHSKGIGKKSDFEYRVKIKEWFEDIYKIEQNRPHLDTAAACDELKIIFDFGSDNVDSVTMAGQNSSGTMYPSSKWIIIGGKLTNKNGSRDDEIKGVIAHEICHYSMRLLYENSEKPFFKHDTEAEEKFTRIVNEINKWTHEDAKNLDDECGGIISTVFTCYQPEDWHPELIVRVPQIYTQFSNNESKISRLQNKYSLLFDFHNDDVLPDLRNFNMKERENVRKFNENAKLLDEIRVYELACFKDTCEIIENKVREVQTNAPKLLLLNIFNNLYSKYESLVDAMNIFIDARSLKKIKTLTELSKILEKNSKVCIYIDCSIGIDENIKEQLNLLNAKYTLIFSSPEKNDECRKLNKIELVSKNMTITYDWNDLSGVCQKKLLQTKVRFQNETENFTIFDLTFKEPHYVNTMDMYTNSINQVIDNELFDIMLRGDAIFINKNQNETEKSFNLLFQMRIFRKKYIFKDSIYKNYVYAKSRSQPCNVHTNRTTVFFNQDDFVEDIENMKYVLISDVAGTGKSWIMKKMSILLCNKYPSKWTSLIDLKQFIKEFKSATGATPKFSSFIADKILRKKLKKFEIEIFKMMYNNGRVIILFDGFDEIAPDCAEFVTNLAESFEFNYGNQLFIATRDYFENDIEKKLNIYAVYKLEPFTDNDGLNLMISAWIMNELGDNFELKAGMDFSSIVKSYENYEIYKKQAIDLQHQIQQRTHNSVGFPLFYKMVASVFEKNSNIKSDFTIYRIFKEFVKMQIKRWSHEKGELRETESDDIHANINPTGFIELHQFLAMKGYFTNNSSFCGLKIDRSIWIDEKIIACGLLTKNDENFFFPHETFREYFSADFILSILMKDENLIDEEFINYFLNFLTKKEYNVIRMFLNDALSEKRIENTIQTKYSKILSLASKYGKDFDYLSQLIENNNPNLENLLKKLLQIKGYKNIKNELIHHLKIDIHSKDFQNQTLNIKNILTFASKILTFKDIKEFFLLKSKQKLLYLKEKKFNLLYEVVCGSLDKFKVIWDFSRNYFPHEIDVLNIIQQVNEDGDNLFQFFLKNSRIDFFKYVLQELEGTEEEAVTVNRDEIKKIMRCLGSKKKDFFQVATDTKEISPEFCKRLCRVIRKYFSSCEIMDMIKHTEEYKKDFVETLLNTDGNKLHAEIMKELRSTKDIKKILNCLNKSNQNLLQNALRFSPKNFKYFCEIIRKHFTFSEVQHMIIHTDNHGNSVLSYILKKLKLEHILEEDEKITKLECINKIGKYLLSLVGTHYNGFENFKFFLNFTFFLYYDEFIDFIHQVNEDGDNIFHLAIKKSRHNVLKFIFNEFKENDVWNQIVSKEEVKRLLLSLGNEKRNLLQNSLKIMTDWIHSLIWELIITYIEPCKILDMITDTNVDEKNYIESALCNRKSNLTLALENIKLTLDKNGDKDKEIKFKNILKSRSFLYAMKNCSIENFKLFWKFYVDLYEDELPILFKQVDGCGNNIFHVVVLEMKMEIFQFMIQEMEESEKFNENSEIVTIKDMLKFSEGNQQNLLQMSAKTKTGYKATWRIIKNYFTPSEIVEMINHPNQDGDSLINIAILSNDENVFQITVDEVMKLICEDSIQSNNLKMLVKNSSLTSDTANNLYLCYLNDAFHPLKNTEIFKIIWSNFEIFKLFWKFCIFLFGIEFIEALKEVNDDGNNLIFVAIIKSEESYFQFIIEQLGEIEKINDDFTEEIIKMIFTCVNHEQQNLLQMAIIRRISLQNQLTLLDVITNKLTSLEITKMINHKDKNNQSSIQIAVLNKNLDILKKNFEIARTANNCDYITQSNEYGENLIIIAVKHSTDEIFKCIIEELQKIKSVEAIKEILSLLCSSKKHLLQIALERDFFLPELLKSVWIVIRKYFTFSEILVMITHNDSSDGNILLFTLKSQNIEAIKITSEEIKKIIVESQDQQNLEQIKSILQEQVLLNVLKDRCVNIEKCKAFWRFYIWLYNEKVIKSLSVVDEDGNNFFHVSAKESNLEILNFMVGELEETAFKESISKEKNIKEYLECLGENRQNLLQIAVKWSGRSKLTKYSLASYERFWIIIRNYFTPYEILSLITHIDENKENVISILLKKEHTRDIEDTLYEIKNTLNEIDDNKKVDDFKKIFQEQKYLLLLFESYWPDDEKIKVFWQFIVRLYNGDLIKILEQVDEDGNNIFHLAIKISSIEIFEFMIKNYRIYATDAEMTKISLCLDNSMRNLLQIGVEKCICSIELNERIWIFFRNNFDACDIFNMITHKDKNGNNLFQSVIEFGSLDILELNWEQIKNFILEFEYQAAFLRSKGKKNRSLLQQASKNKLYKAEIKLYIKNLMHEYKVD